jgi:hypothetical protein
LISHVLIDTEVLALTILIAPSAEKQQVKIGAGGGTRREINGFCNIHYSLITHQLPRKNRLITYERQ